MMMALMIMPSQQGRGERESREMAESPILHELPRIRSVTPGKSSSPNSSSSSTTAATPPDSYFTLQPHGPKSSSTRGLKYVDVEKSETDIGIAITTQSPGSPASTAPSTSPYTPISPSLFPIPPSRSSTPNVSMTTVRSQSTLATKRSGLSLLGDVSMTPSSTSVVTPATSFSSPASTPTPFSPKRTSPSPRFTLMPTTPSPVYSPRCIGSRSPRIYAKSSGGRGGDVDANNGLHVETRHADAEDPASKSLRQDRRQSEHSQHSQHSIEPPRSPAYSGSWLEVPGPRPGLGSRSTSGASGYSTASSVRTDADSDSISPILSQPALKAFHGSNGDRHSVSVNVGGGGGGDYDTHSLSAMWFGETRRKNYDFMCGGGPEPDFAVAVVRERQRRRRRARRVKMAGGAAVIAVLVVVAIVVGVSLSVG